MIDEPNPLPGAEEVIRHAYEGFDNAMDEQEAKGLKTYGTRLMTFNGRDAYHDFCQEYVDAFMYGTQLMLEHCQAIRDIHVLVQAEQVRSNNDCDDSMAEQVAIIKRRWGVV